MKLRKIMGMASAIILAVALVGCSSPQQPAPPPAAKPKVDLIKAAGKMVLGTSPDYPPYEFPIRVEGGTKIVGVDILIAEEIAKDLGVKLEIRELVFDSILLALDSGEIDIGISGFNPKPERRESNDFSDIYILVDYGFLAPKDKAAAIQSQDDLRNLTVGVQRGTTMEDTAKELAQEVPNLTIKSLGKIPELILELQSGNIDVMFADKPVAESQANANPAFAVAPYTIPDSEGGFAAAFKKGNEDFVAAVNKTLARLNQEGKIEQFLLEAREIEAGQAGSN